MFKVLFITNVLFMYILADLFLLHNSHKYFLGNNQNTYQIKSDSVRILNFYSNTLIDHFYGEDIWIT